MRVPLASIFLINKFLNFWLRKFFLSWLRFHALLMFKKVKLINIFEKYFFSIKSSKRRQPKSLFIINTSDRSATLYRLFPSTTFGQRVTLINFLDLNMI